MIATHEDSDGTGYCRECGTTIGEEHHSDCDVLELHELHRRCKCGHPEDAHVGIAYKDGRTYEHQDAINGSAHSFCWFCTCVKFVPHNLNSTTPDVV
jgi:hypothetical protein